MDLLNGFSVVQNAVEKQRNRHQVQQRKQQQRSNTEVKRIGEHVQGVLCDNIYGRDNRERSV